MSLSKPDETKLSRMAVTAFPSAKTEGQPSLQPQSLVLPIDSGLLMDARLKHSSMALLKLMIKEDHLLACTTRMFEIQIALPFLRISPDG